MNKSYKILSTTAFIFTLNVPQHHLIAASKGHVFSDVELEQIEVGHNNPQKIHSPLTKEIELKQQEVVGDSYFVTIQPKIIRVQATIKSVSKQLPKVFGPDEV